MSRFEDELQEAARRLAWREAESARREAESRAERNARIQEIDGLVRDYIAQLVKRGVAPIPHGILLPHERRLPFRKTEKYYTFEHKFDAFPELWVHRPDSESQKRFVAKSDGSWDYERLTWREENGDLFESYGDSKTFENPGPSQRYVIIQNQYGWGPRDFLFPVVNAPIGRFCVFNKEYVTIAPDFGLRCVSQRVHEPRVSWSSLPEGIRVKMIDNLLKIDKIA